MRTRGLFLEELIEPGDLADPPGRRGSVASGFWFCRDCQARCEREEGEQGQPAHCSRCRSHRIQYFPPPL
jgi:hypothetical protein